MCMCVYVYVCACVCPRVKLLEKKTSLTYISVGHRPSLLDFHDSKLRLKHRGFELEAIRPDAPHSRTVL